MNDEFEQYLAQPAEPDEFEEFKLPESKGAYKPLPRPSFLPGHPVSQAPMPENMQRAADSGVNIDAKLPNKESAIASLAANPIEEQAYIEAYLSKRYDNPPVRTGPDTGELEFFNPETEMWELARPNAASALGSAFDFFPATAGAIAGSMNPVAAAGGPLGVATGGSMGAGLGQAIGTYGKTKLGQKFGINESINDASLATNALTEGLTTGAIDLGTAGLYGAGRGIKAVIFGKQFLKPHEAQELLNAQRRMDVLINEVEKNVPGATFRPFTAAGSDTEAADKLMSAGRQVMDDPEVGHKMSRLVLDNEKVLAAYYDNITLKNRMALGAPNEGAIPLKGAIEGERSGAMDPLVAQRAAAQDQAQQQLDAMPKAGPAQAGSAIRQGLAEKHEAAKLERRNAYAKYTDEAGYRSNGTSKFEVPISSALRADQRNLAKAINRSILGTDAEGKKRAKLILEKGQKTINLADLDSTLKALREDIRSSEKGELGLPMDRLAAKRLETELSKMRDDFLEANAPEAKAALDAAEHASFVEAQTFRRGLAKTLLMKEGGEYKLTDARVISTILRNKDPQAAEAIADILKSNPKAMNEAQNYLFALYRRSVATDAGRALPVYKNHQRFMENYGPILDKFFTPAQRDEIRQLGGLAKVINDNTKNLKLLETAWNKSFKGKVDNMSAEALVDGVFTKSLKNEDIRGIVSIAGRYSPDVLNSWKAGVADKMRERMFKDGLIDGTYLNRLMNDHDTMGKVTTIFGQSYVNNLRTLKKAVDLSRRTPHDVKLPGKNTFWTDLARAVYAPPLSREGRAVSMFQNTRSRNLANQVYQALSDPAALEKMATRTRRTMQTVAGLTIGTTALQELQSD